MKTIVSTDGRKYERVSRWITWRTNYSPSKRNSLWDYVTDGAGHHPYSDKFDRIGDHYLDYFKFNGRTYAIEQFLALGGPWAGSCPIMYEDEDGKLNVIGAIDSEDIYHPLYMEVEEGCERIRLYRESK